MAVENRKLLQLAGSTLEKILALNGDNAIQARELLVATDTHQLVLGNGDGTGTIIGSAVVGTSHATADPKAGQFYFDTTDNNLYIGTGTEWKPVLDLDAFAIRDDDGVENNIAKLDANGNAVDSGMKFADTLADGDDGATTVYSAKKVEAAIAAALSAAADESITKVDDAVENNVPVFTADGEVKDSGFSFADTLPTNNDGASIVFSAKKVNELLEAAADDVEDNYIPKVASATVNAIATLTSDGDVQDSGVSIDDNSQSTTNLWSAEKTAQAIADAVNGLSWQKPVKSAVKKLADDVTPVAGDRYLVLADAEGDFAGHDNTIAEYDGSAWVFYTPVDGAAVFAEDDDDQWAYNGADWVNIASALSYSAGNGINIADKTITAVVKANNGLTVGQEGIELVLDETSLVVNDEGKVEVNDLDFGTF